MSRSPKEAIIIVLDISLSAAEEVYEGDKTFLALSKKCIERIIERKIFSSAGDEIGLVLLGTEETANALQYDHISEGFRMTNPSWEMLKIIHDIKGTRIDKCDWIDALVVAMDILQTQTEGKKFTATKIVLFVYPDNEVSEDKLDKIINGIQTLEIELTAIGVNLFPENETEQEEMDHNGNDENDDTKICVGNLSGRTRKEKSIALMQHIVNESRGVSCNFEDALSQLNTYQLKTVRPTPWNVFLQIGQDIKIPVAAYKKIASVSLPTWQKTVRQDTKKIGDTPTSDSQHAVDVRLEQERVYMRDDRTVVEKDDRIAGYYFGSSAVPFNEFDNEQLKYKSGDKCLNVLGFAKRTDVERRFFIGEGVYYIVPQKKNLEGQQALSAFIQTLHEKQMVAISTKVYRKDSAPTIAALFPLLKKKFKCLLLVELPYSEEVNEFIFPRVVPEKQEPTEEELAAVDSLMDCMDLMDVEKDGERNEAFRLKDTVDPALMYNFRCIAHRALHPNEPLPTEFDDIKETMTCPFLSHASYQLALETVKNKFRIIEQPEMSSLKKEEKTNKNGKAESLGSDQQPSTSGEGAAAANILHNVENITKNALTEVGTVKPHEDFVTLLARGEQFKPVCEQMENIILKLVLNSFGSESFNKALLALSTLRKSCVEKDPVVYNNWLPDFKKTLSERDRLKFWELVAKDGLGLITTEENTSSNVCPQDAVSLLKEAEEPEKANEHDVDADDLIDEM